MVVILAAPSEEIGVWHARIGWPSASTVQAPHWAMPQPYFVPVRPSSSRSTHNNGVSGGELTFKGRPFTSTVIAMRPLHRSCSLNPNVVQTAA
jgi:hypothetical protein